MDESDGRIVMYFNYSIKVGRKWYRDVKGHEFLTDIGKFQITTNDDRLYMVEYKGKDIKFSRDYLRQKKRQIEEESRGQVKVD